MSVQPVGTKTHPFQKQGEPDLLSQEKASLSGKILSASSEPATKLQDRMVSAQPKSKTTPQLEKDERNVEEKPGWFDWIFHHRVTRTVGSAAIMLLATWATGKAIDSLKGPQPSSPIEPGAEDTSLSPFMESISMRHGRDKDPVGPQEREPRDPTNREHDNWASEPPYEPGQEKGK